MDREIVKNSRRVVFREEIRDAIREAIFSGELKPGDRIIETYWAKELGVSQGPVREAIRDLEASGLVETVPFKGSHVRLLTKKDVWDNYSVRICLESMSIRDAITMLSDENMEKLTNRLQELLNEMDGYAKQGDLHSFTECDAAFHRAIILAVDNQVLLKMWETCNIRNWLFISVLSEAENLMKLESDHQHIFRAICARDVKEAVSTLEKHVTGLMDEFIRSACP